jgi:pilus assembly protein CpaC
MATDLNLRPRRSPARQALSVRVIALTMLVASGIVASAPALAQQSHQGAALHGGTIEVPVNKSQIVSTDQQIVRVMIGNPEIADIVPVTERSVYVLGKEVGTTSLTLYGYGGRVLSVVDIAVGPDVQGLRDQIDKLVPGSGIEASLSGDSIVLSGVSNDAGSINRAVQLAKTYAGDKVVNLVALGASQQVMLEVRFSEVKRDVGQNIGVSGFFNGGNEFGAIGKGASITPDPVTGASQIKVGSVTETFGVLGATFSVLGANVEAYLDALEQKGFAKRLAEPTLVALWGEKASFLAGGEFPIPVVQGGGGGGAGGFANITVEFKPFGVSLGFTPTVLGDNTINLKVEPEVSSIDRQASIQLNDIVIPGIQTRRASTTLELRDGESFAIAGLLQRDFASTVRQVPLLGNIPIIGALFRSTEFQKGETELLIVVTPRLVRPIRPDQVRLPTDRVADPDPTATVLTGEAYDPLPNFPNGTSTTAPETKYEF